MFLGHGRRWPFVVTFVILTTMALSRISMLRLGLPSANLEKERVQPEQDGRPPISGTRGQQTFVLHAYGPREFTIREPFLVLRVPDMYFVSGWRLDASDVFGLHLNVQYPQMTLADLRNGFPKNLITISLNYSGKARAGLSGGWEWLREQVKLGHVNVKYKPLEDREDFDEAFSKINTKIPSQNCLIYVRNIPTEGGDQYVEIYPNNPRPSVDVRRFLPIQPAIGIHYHYNKRFWGERQLVDKAVVDLITTFYAGEIQR